MKKLIYQYSILILFSALLLTGCGNKKKDKPETNQTETTVNKSHKWNDEDKQVFKNNSNSFLKAHSVENPEKYTDCLLETVMKEYPDPDKAMDASQNEMADLFESSDCLDDLTMVKIISQWNKETETIFIRECVKNAKKHYKTEADAKSYCECVLTEIKKIIPNPQHVVTLTEEEYNSVIKKCEK